jgi:eukaryotic-like serine/threonine-protein kinase
MPADDQTSGVTAGRSRHTLQPGARIGPYQIEAVLGEGGMGVVFRARDTRLRRLVALKLIRPEYAGQPEFRHRFEREARAISALSHPHICNLYDVGDHQGSPYLVMEHVEGETLAATMKRGPLPVDQVLHFGVQIADALAAAHVLGIVHRDLKPGNIMVTPSGVKVLDFGLAKQSRPVSPDVATATATIAETRPGEAVGTTVYMSPEQAAGKPVDAHSDVFALGVILYEMLCGRRPFQGDSTLETLAAILHAVPELPRKLRPETPAALEQIVLRCLEKQPAARFASAGDLHRELETCLAPRKTTLAVPRAAVVAAVLLMTAGAVALGAREYLRVSRARWAEQEATPQITALIEQNRRLAASSVFGEAERYAPASRRLLALSEGLVTSSVSIATTPPGAQIYIDDYIGDASHWELIGETPVETSRIPFWGYYRIRAVKKGFAPVERAYNPAFDGRRVEMILWSEASVPEGMVWVNRAAAGEPFSMPPAPAIELPGFWIDKYEVTNRRFKEFVDARGYQKPEYWKHPFVKNGRVLSWAEATAEFRDATGRVGPATWQLGSPIDGTEDLPVGGVSWYEAAAYAEFAGKSLPTVYEWYRAAGATGTSDVLRLSNFGGRGPSSGGTTTGMARFGAYDMAGNLKEWAANSTGEQRYTLGGAWNELGYMYSSPDARTPFDRSAVQGFRCVQRITPPPTATLAPLSFFPGRGAREAAADDRAFRLYADLHAYDKTAALDAKVVRIDESSPYWRRETVTFRAAYDDRSPVIAHLFLPRNAKPPYQVVTFFGTAQVLSFKSIDDLPDPYQFVVRSGRVLMIPAYVGTLERGPSPAQQSPDQARDVALKYSKDLGRSIDYLETRPEIDTGRLAFYGISFGALHGVRLVALEPRIKTAVLLTGGLTGPWPGAEVDPSNYASRIRVPVLMLNGRDDFILPLETSQLPLFRALGTPEADKKHVLYPGGHINLMTRPEVIAEILDWLDRYLGPVSPQ